MLISGKFQNIREISGITGQLEALILHRMQIWHHKSWTNACTNAWTDGQVILYPVQCYALHWTDNNICNLSLHRS